MSNRIKVTTTAIKTRAEADSTLGEIRSLTIQRNQTLLKKEKEVAAIEEKYKDTLDEIGKDLEVKSELLSGWATNNPSEFGNLKSLELTHGRLGWRTGMPKLIKTAKEKWDDMVVRIREHLGTAFVRTSEEVDKAAILKAHGESPFDPAQLRLAGVKIAQEESFFVEPKIEEVDNRTVVAA